MKRFGRKGLKWLSLTMSICMILASTGCGNKTNGKTDETEKGLQVESEDETDLEDIISGSVGHSSVSDADKEETVYLISDASGNVQETIVSEWLKNTNGSDELVDVSSLSDIVNVKGDEGFTQDGSKLTWESGGSDIYYQGTSDAEAPVAVKVSYKLDGKDITPDELEGKSGHLTIRYEYENNSEDTGDFVPFVMATGMILDMNKFFNIEVTNGRLINDGSRNIVVGYGLPGISDKLNLGDLDEYDITLPDYFEVEADVRDFELDMSITVASVETIGDDVIDISEAEETIDGLASEYSTGMDSLVDGISEYTAGVDEVADGVNTLSSGTDTLYSGSETLKNGIESAASGADTIKSGLDTAYSGSQDVSDGADAVASGASAVNDGAIALKNGASDAYDGAVAVSDGASQLNDAVQAIELPDVNTLASSANTEETAAAVKTSAETILGSDTVSYVSSAVTGVVTGAISSDTVSQVVAYQTGGAQAVADAASSAGAGQADTATSLGQTEGATAATNYAGDAQATAVAIVQNTYGDAFDPTDATQAALISTITQAIAGGYGTAYCTGYGNGYAAEYQNYLTEFGSYTTALENGFGGESFTGSVSNVANAYASAGSQVTLGKVGETLDGFSTQLDALKTGTQSLADGSSALTSGLSTLKTGTSDLADGTGALNTGAATLSSGTDSLVDGLSQLDTGAGTLQSGMSELKSGSSTLYNGVGTLKSGVAELKSGTDTLSSNSQTLNDGAGTLQDATSELMDKLSETEDGVDEFVENINTLNEAGRNYKSYGGALSTMTVKTQFVIKVDGIGEDKK